MDWQDEIITLFVQLCDEYKNGLWTLCQRFTNYADLSFRDEEVMTIYMYGTIEGRTTKKQIYEHAKKYWNDLFPKLPSYVAFVQRVNKLGDVFTALVEVLQKKFSAAVFAPNKFRVIDSMPIVMAQRGRRFNAKVAPELADKNGYCATKKMYYYGIKLHILGSAQKGKLPVPEMIGITRAGESDIAAYEIILPDIAEYEKFADKAYLSAETAKQKTYTPVKKQKGQEYLDAADQLYSTAVSRIRQPIESIFSWIEEKTKIQIASKVRSHNGLIVHVFGKLATAMNLLVARFSS